MIEKNSLSKSIKSKIYIVFIFIVLLSCQSHIPKNETPIEESIWEPVSNLQEESYIAEIRPELISIQEYSISSEHREVYRPKVSGEKVEKLLLKTEGMQVPIVLEVIYVDNIANPKATYFFRNQQLLAVVKSKTFFLFKNNKLQVWANEHWEPYKNKSVENWLDQENFLLSNAKKYLEAFDFKYED